MSAQKRSASVTAPHLGWWAGRYCPRPYDLVRRARPTAARDRLLRARGTLPHDLRRSSSALTTTIHLHGARRGGARRGRHLRPGRAARPARRRARCCRSPGSWTLDSFSRHLDGLDLFGGAEPGMPAYLDYRRWAFESAAADLALRQAGRSLADVLGREPQPINFVVSLRLGEPPSAEPVTQPARRLPGAAVQARLLARVGRRAARSRSRRRAPSSRSTSRAPTRARRSTSTPIPTSTGAAPRSSPQAWLEDPDLTDPGGRRGAAPAPRPDHLGRADPRRRRHRGAAVPAADDQRQAVAHRHLEEAAAHLRVVRRARHHQLRRRPVRAGRRPRPDPVPRVDLPRRRGERHRARGLRLGRVPGERPARQPAARRTWSRRASAGARRLVRAMAKPRQVKMEQKGALAAMQKLESRSDEELEAETRYRAAAQAILGARAAERMDAKRSREHFRAAIAAARPQERLQLRRMAEASLALAERRPGDLKAAAEKLGQTPPTNRQLLALRADGHRRAAAERGHRAPDRRHPAADPRGDRWRSCSAGRSSSWSRCRSAASARASRSSGASCSSASCSAG